MPPRPKYSKEEIVQASYELMSEKGMDAVVAREVGKRLGTTTAPIFTYFNTMDELKEEVYGLARKICSDYLNDSIHYKPAFKEFGMRWIRFAKDYPNVYKLLFMNKNKKGNSIFFVNSDFIEVMDHMTEEVEATFEVSKPDARQIINDSCIYAQGIADLCVNEMVDYSEEDISKAISRCCLSLVAAVKIMDESMNPDIFKRMFSHLEAMPVKTQRRS